MVSGRLACTSSKILKCNILDFNSELSIQSSVYFHQKIKEKDPWFNILQQPEDKIQCLEYLALGMHNFDSGSNLWGIKPA